MTTLFIAVVFVGDIEFFWFDGWMVGDAKMDDSKCVTPFILTSPILTDLPFLSVIANRLR